MSRRPYIEPKNIKDSLRPGPSSSSRPDGYLAGPSSKEVVGMDGRNDWFRCECRECGRTMITRRNEKSTRYYSCPDCGTWHFQHSGFFNPDRFETQPLRPDEVTTDLYHAVTTESDYGSISEFYGSLDYICEKVESDYFDLVSVWLVTEDEELLVQEGDIDVETLKGAVVQ